MNFCKYQSPNLVGPYLYIYSYMQLKTYVLEILYYVTFCGFTAPPDEENQIRKLVVTLTDAESDDESDAPELFSRQEHEEKYGKIAQLKTDLHNEEVEPYLEQFHDTVTDDVLQIGNISIHEVQVRSNRKLCSPKLLFGSRFFL